MWKSLVKILVRVTGRKDDLPLIGILTLQITTPALRNRINDLTLLTANQGRVLRSVIIIEVVAN